MKEDYTLTPRVNASPLSAADALCAPLLCFALFAFASRRVKLSGDVEENPGPNPGQEESLSEPAVTTPHKTQNLQENITQLEVNLQQKLDSIPTVMQTQAETLNRQEDTLRRFKTDQEAMQKSIADLCQDVKDTKRGVQQNTEAITRLSTKQDDLRNTVGDLETEIDRLEGFSRHNNIKLFGVPESTGEEQEDCAEVVRYVLETYILEKTWDPDVIKRAHRLGKPNSHNHNPHPIIAQFQRWGDAMRVMKDCAAREGMEKGGLRVAQDLTRRQAARLRDLRSEGKMGYFVNGKLRVKDQRDTVPRSPNRWFNTDSQRAAGQRESQGLFTNTVTQPRHARDHDRPISEDDIVADVTASQAHGTDSHIPVRVDATARPQTRSTVARQVSLNELAWGNTTRAPRAEDKGNSGK
ncbi:hypothetical protein ACOMHN_001481 [Nucella lapillus]